MESVSDCSDAVHDEKMEAQTEILQNGFNPEEDNCDNCERALKPQDTVEETTSCPVIPKRAALLYPSKHLPGIVSFWGAESNAKQQLKSRVFSFQFFFQFLLENGLHSMVC